MPSELQKQEASLKRSIIVDRMNRHTVDTKLALVEEEMLSNHINLYNKMFNEREHYDVTKPVPYDKH